MDKTKTGIYVRISRDIEGDAHGVDSQRKSCTKYAKSNDMTVVEVYEDNDITASGAKVRPDFERLLDDIKHGDITLVLARDTDRLYRSLKDYVRLTEALKEGGAALITINGGTLDLTTSSGQLQAEIMASVHANEIRHMAERGIASQEYRAGLGMYRQPAPFGYINKGKGVIEPHPTDSKIVQEVARRVIAGETLFSITKWVASTGAKPKLGAKKWTTTNVRKMILSPTQAGLVTHKGEILGPGKWQANISETDWLKVKAILEDPARRTTQGQARRWQGSGVYRCAVCGAGLKAKTFKANGEYFAYVCPNNHLTVNQEKLDEHIEMIIIPYLDEKRNRIQLNMATNGDRLPRLLDERRELVERSDTLGALAATGDMTPGQLKRANKVIAEQLEELDRKISKEKETASPIYQLLEAKNLTARWKNLSADLRAEIIGSLLEIEVDRAAHKGRKFDYDRVKVRWK